MLPVLREAFPACGQEIVALTLTRIAGYTPLSRVGDAWEKLDNVLDLSADCDPRTLVGSPAEIDTARATLVLDRGFAPKKNETILTEAKILIHPSPAS